MIVCPNCGEENPPKARFCLSCGTPLSQGQSRGEERKVVTVMFCDLVGFTARSDGADPEDVKATLQPYHARLKLVIEHYGGTIDKFIGDGVLAVFGAPAVHEDDPERAVRAALRSHDAVADLNRANPRLDLAVRIGINTGEAVVSFGAGPQIGESVTGDVVNTASRLQNVAPVGGIVVGEPTYRATSEAFEFEQLPPVRVKGKEEPLAIWRPIRLRSTFGVGVESRLRPPTPMVGRADQLAHFKAAFHRAMGDPSVQLVTISGEPGLGKTRLIAELFAYVDDLPDIYQWRQGRCLPYGEGVTFWPLGEIVKAQAGILDSDPIDLTMQKLARAVEPIADGPAERDWMVARLATVAGRAVGMEDGAVRSSDVSVAAFDRTESFAAWRRFLEAEAGERPLVLVFEDLHWGEPPLLDFIEDLADSPRRVPLLVVSAARPELFDARPGWGKDRRNATLLQLEPLTEPETSVLISALLDRAVLPAETQSLLLERAGGNPLYAEEFVRMLRDQDLLEEHGRVLTLKPEADVSVPQSIRGLIAARLDALAPESKEVLHDASVIGKVFWAGALAAMGDRNEQDVRERLDDLTAKEMVRPSRRSTLEGEAEHSFSHMLVRDVAYGQIPRADRAAKHRKAASWIERVSRERAVDQSEQLAWHYEQALELARATHQDREAVQVAPHLLRFLLMAGDKAMRLDVNKAEGYYRRTLDLVLDQDSDPVLRSWVLIRAAEAESVAGRYPEAERDYQAAIDGFRAAGDAVGEGGALALMSRGVHKVGDTARAAELLERAITLLDQRPPSGELVRALTRSAGQALLGGRNEACLELTARALPLAERFGMEDEVVRALQFRGAARLELGDQAGLEDLWRALETGQRLGLGEEVSLTYGNLAYQLWLRDGPHVALATWVAAKEFSELRGFESNAMWSRAGMVECLFDLGQWDEILGHTEEMLAWDRGHGGSVVGSFAELYTARVLAGRGEFGEAAASIEPAVEAFRKMQQVEFLAPALAVAAQVRLGLGDGAQAAALLEEFEARTDESLSFRAQYLPDAMRVAVEAGALQLGQELVVGDAQVRANRHMLGALTGRALLAEATGRTGEAARDFAQAARGWHSYGAPLEQAHALLGEARCRGARGDRAGAERAEHEAEVVLASVPAGRYAGEAGQVQEVSAI